MKIENENIKGYVCNLVGTKIYLVLVDSNLESAINKMGFEYDERINQWIIDVSENDHPKLFSSLRDQGFCFSNGPDGWPPGAIFEHWREVGKISGKFNSITWRGENDFYVYET